MNRFMLASCRQELAMQKEALGLGFLRKGLGRAGVALGAMGAATAPAGRAVSRATHTVAAATEKKWPTALENKANLARKLHGYDAAHPGIARMDPDAYESARELGFYHKLPLRTQIAVRKSNLVRGGAKPHMAAILGLMSRAPGEDANSAILRSSLLGGGAGHFVNRADRHALRGRLLLEEGRAARRQFAHLEGRAPRAVDLPTVSALPDTVGPMRPKLSSPLWLAVRDELQRIVGIGAM